MSEAVVAKRYAEALFRLGEEKNTLDELTRELRVVREVFQDNKKQIYTFLEHPRIKSEQKKLFLHGVLQGMQIDVVHMLQLLVERHRIAVTPSMIDHFIQLVNDAKGTAEATVYSVQELSEGEKEALKKNLEKRFNKKTVELENVVDTSIMGGLKIRVGNTIFDGSLSGKLQRIERDILTANR